MIATIEAAASLGRQRASTTSRATALASRAYVSSNTGLPGAIKVDQTAGHRLVFGSSARHSAPKPFPIGHHPQNPTPVTSESFPALPAPSTPPLAVAQPAGGGGGGAVPYPESPAEPPKTMATGDGIPRAVPGPTPMQIGLGLAVLVGVALVARKVLK